MRFSARNIPYEWIVYVDKPSFAYGGGIFIRTVRIPRGKTYRDMLDTLSPTVSRLKVVKAYDAATAREAAAQQGIRFTEDEIRDYGLSVPTRIR